MVTFRVVHVQEYAWMLGVHSESSAWSFVLIELILACRQAMKETKGKADPVLLNKLLMERLDAA